jgi:hypothetical protein
VREWSLCFESSRSCAWWCQEEEDEEALSEGLEDEDPESARSRKSRAKKGNKKKKKKKGGKDRGDDDRSKRRRKRPRPDGDYDSEDYPPSLVSGDSYASYLRRRATHRRKNRGLRAPSPGSDYSEFEEWRAGIHVPTDKTSLLARSLQATLQGPVKPQDTPREAQPKPRPKVRGLLCGPDAAAAAAAAGDQPHTLALE